MTTIKMNYPMMSEHERKALNAYKQTYTRLLVAYSKAVADGSTPVGYEQLVIEVDNLGQQLPPSIAFSARKHIDLIWDPTIREAYEGVKRTG